MKRNKIIYFSGLLALLTACQANDETVTPDTALEISSITPTIAVDNQSLTRAAEPKMLGVGRTAFQAGDEVVLTTIRRSQDALEPFTYSNIPYAYNDTWKRTTTDPEKIYWTDVTSYHTFAGYSLPSENYYWVLPTANTTEPYQGELGYGMDSDKPVDFSSGNDAIIAKDLLISYSDSVKAVAGSTTTAVGFTHALSNVCIVVNIKNFATGDNVLDADVDVTDMTILNQPCKFKWSGYSKELSTLNCDDSNGQTKRNIKLWRKSTSGSGAGKTFTFYGLTTPQDAAYLAYDANNSSFEFDFKVKYRDVDDGGNYVTHNYHGIKSGVLFNSGKTTTINVALSHSGEKMHIDVNYSNWNLVPTPDLGVLRKKSTYMTMNVDNTAIKTHSQVDNIDDAIWLYESNNVVKDVYGNDGTSAATAFRITSALQMLAFAKEVNRDYDFTGKYVRLDADITMQSSATASDYVWKGIGERGNEFNGTFLGGDRYINRLNGSPLFVKLGGDACVEQLHITAVGNVTNGTLAGTNAGIIGGCKVIDDVTLSGDGAGALVGTNTGTIHASYYTGAGNLVGTNSDGDKTGTIVGCYQASDITSFTKEFLTNFIDGTDGENPTNGLNDDLNAFYSNESNSKKFRTQFNYTFTPGNYPTVKVVTE